MTELPVAAPALYTPDDHLFAAAGSAAQRSHADLEESAFNNVYDIDRTVLEIVEKGYRRVALQFPDELLGDSTRVYGLISRGINKGMPYYMGSGSREKPVVSEGCGGSQSQGNGCCSSGKEPPPNGTQKDSQNGCCGSQENCTNGISASQKPDSQKPEEKQVFILADTSYSACCIDEIAAEHCSADVLVHYGRSCLSPTTRLPIIYVFTTNPLNLTLAASSFCSTFPDKSAKVVLMADVTYTAHIPALHKALTKEGYEKIFSTTVIHDPSSPLPNRTHPPSPEPLETLRSYSLFHISAPLPSLLLVLASRVASIYTYIPNTHSTTSLTPTTLLRRRYALLSHARTAGIIGILINTLNVKNYLPMITTVKRQIHSAGRKSYLVVVGKVNVEKVANFPEVEVWVGIGCWEQGIVGSESGREFYRPVITPFELGMALDKTRVWSGEWITDFETLLKADKGVAGVAGVEGEGGDSEDEPPEFDLRTGKYISTSRPLRQQKERVKGNGTSTALVAGSDPAKQLVVGGVVSPAAEFLRDKKSWRGLGSDFVIEYEKEGGDGAVVEDGRSGVARGYTVGEEVTRH